MLGLIETYHIELLKVPYNLRRILSMDILLLNR
jgi:hypothetical protein